MAAGAGDQLHDPLRALEVLHVVVVPVEHERGVAADGVPQGLDARPVAVATGVQEGAVPERDAACPGLADLPLGPPHSAGPLGMSALRS